MIKFITDNKKHVFDGIILDSKTGIKQVITFLKKARKEGSLIGKDYETNGLCPITNQPLLLALGNENIQYIIDCTTISISFLKDFEDLTYIGANIKFDISFSMNHYGIACYNVIDVTIADQKLFQGAGFSKDDINGLKWQLDHIVKRHLGFKPVEMDKNIRNDFINMSISKALFLDRHIRYTASDIAYLFQIWEKQKILLKRYKLLWWVTTYEFPLISVLAECENKGFAFNIEKWKKNIAENEIIKHDYAVKLDNLVIELRDSYCTGEQKKFLRGGRFGTKRNKEQRVKTVGLFGEMSEYDFYAASSNSGQVAKNKKKQSVKYKTNSNVHNWGSGKTILDLFARMGIPAPLQGQAARKYNYLIPHFDIKKGLNLAIGYKYTTINSRYIKGEKVTIPNHSSKDEGWTTGQKAFQKYLIDFPTTPLREFIFTLAKYSRAATEISNFGNNYISNVNPVTGRIHTIYRQMNSVNGRLQSGGGKNLPNRYNSQNIPRDAKFRTCFYAEEGYKVVTCDLNGAEVTFMADKAEDYKLYEFAVINDDSHSPMVQNVWRNIYLFRAGRIANLWFNCTKFIELHKQPNIIKKLEDHSNPLVQKWFNLSKTFVVSKKVNKPFRQGGKNGTFGGVYGMHGKKAQETYNNTDTELAKISSDFEPVNVTLEEGKVSLYAQRSLIPKTFKMVETNSKKGLNDGWIVLNKRSYSRIWFIEIVRLKQSLIKEYGKDVGIIPYGDGSYYCESDGQKYQIDWRDRNNYSGRCRNVPISGTQADCLKEAMVDISNYIRKHKIPAYLLSQVHDELVYGFDPNMDDITFTYDNGETIKTDFSEFVRLSMIEAANRYLKHFKMKAAADIEDTWVK